LGIPGKCRRRHRTRALRHRYRTDGGCASHLRKEDAEDPARCHQARRETYAGVCGMSKKKDLIDFDEVAERALKNPEVMAGYVRARAMRLAANAVKKVRQNKKLSQADVARAMGKPQSLVARIEGARTNATV